MNGCRVGSRGAHHALRVVLDPDDVSASSRRVERHGRRVAVLGDRIRHTTTVGAKHLAPTGHVEKRAEVAGRDRLRDGEGVVAGWRRNRHPVEEHTGRDIIFDFPTTNAVVQGGERLGAAVRELATSRACRRDLAHISRWCWCWCGCWSWR